MVAVCDVLAVKVGMRASLLGADSTGGIVDEKGLEEIETVVAKGSRSLTADDVFVGGTAPLREGRLVVGEAGDTGPVLFAWSS